MGEEGEGGWVWGLLGCGEGGGGDVGVEEGEEGGEGGDGESGWGGGESVETGGVVSRVEGVDGWVWYRVCSVMYACIPFRLPARFLSSARMKAMVGVGLLVRVEKRDIRPRRSGLVREEGVRRRNI